MAEPHNVITLSGVLRGALSDVYFMFLVRPLIFYFSPIDPVGLGTLTCLIKPSSSHVGRIRFVPCFIGVGGINPS